MAKYFTRNQVLLNILMEDVEENIELCEQRMDALLRYEDFESYNGEREYYQEQMENKKMLQKLINSERGSSISRPVKIEIGYKEDNGNVNFIESYLSDIKEFN